MLHPAKEQQVLGSSLTGIRLSGTSPKILSTKLPQNFQIKGDLRICYKLMSCSINVFWSYDGHSKSPRSICNPLDRRWTWKSLIRPSCEKSSPQNELLIESLVVPYCIMLIVWSRCWVLEVGKENIREKIFMYLPYPVIYLSLYLNLFIMTSLLNRFL